MQHQFARKDEPMLVARHHHVEIDLREAHLAQARGVELVGQRGEACKERAFVCTRQHLRLRLEMVKGAPGLALDHREPIQNETVPLTRRQLTDHAEVEQGEGAIRVKKDVPRMKIGVEQPIGNEHLQHDVDQARDNPLLLFRVERLDGLVQAQPLHPTHRQHTLARMAPVNGGTLDDVAASKVGAKPLDGPAFLREVQFLERVAPELGEKRA